MVEFMLLRLSLVGMLCSVQGQTFKISTKFMNGKLIFTWSNISTIRNDIIITRDSSSTSWKQVYVDQYAVEDALQYKSVAIKVREYNSSDFIRGYVDYEKTYNVTAVESKEGESKNLSWTAEYFPGTGVYVIFREYNSSVSQILKINNANPPSTEKYVYHSRPFNSVNMLLEVRNITVEDAGYYIGSVTETDAWAGGGVVLVVFGKPVKPFITGNLSIKVRENASLKCESRSTSAPYYYKKFRSLSYMWFINNTRQEGQDWKTYRFAVSKDVKYNRYSCQAKEILESERSEEILVNPLYGPESVTITPTPPDDGLSIHDGQVFGPYNCSADCNPSCTLQWKYKNPSGGFGELTSIDQSTIMLPEQRANRASMVLIRCIVNGVNGTLKSNIKLNIQYFLDPKVYINGKPVQTLTILERNPLLLSCFVEGNPTPEVTLRKLTGNQILGSNVSSWLNYTLIREAQCSDTSTYRCEGNSKEFGSRNQSFFINVQCAPRLDKSISSKTNYGSMSGADVTVYVSLPVVANPLKSASDIAWSGPTWQFISTNVSQRDNVIYKHWINSSIPIPNKDSFGNYTLTFSGQTIAEITINAEDKPQPPLNFTGYSYASGYINLTWLSNFNGGPEQFFILSSKEGPNWRVVKNLTDPGEGNKGYHDIGPLISGKQYWYRLDSCNRISCSSRPAEVKVTVQALLSPISQSSDTTIVIGASVAIFAFVVVLAIIVAVFLVKRKSAQQREKSEKRSSKAKVQDSSQPDVVVYAAVDKSLLMKNRQQADVVESDVIKNQNNESENVYSNTEEAKLLSNSEVKKDNKKKKKKIEKKTQQETEEETGATYGNVESRTVNQDGLIYIDVDFANKSPSSDTKGKPVIHGEEERTEYTFVDFSKKASPLQETVEVN